MKKPPASLAPSNANAAPSEDLAKKKSPIHGRPQAVRLEPRSSVSAPVAPRSSPSASSSNFSSASPNVGASTSPMTRTRINNVSATPTVLMPQLRQSHRNHFSPTNSTPLTIFGVNNTIKL